MSNSKKQNLQGRRKFLTTMGAGVLAATALSSCDKLPKISTDILGRNSQKSPTKKEVEALLRATGELDSNAKALMSLRETVLKLPGISTELTQMITKESIEKTLEEQTEYLYNLYKKNFTREEVKFLTDFFKSPVRQKLEQVREDDRVRTDSSTVPIRKSIQRVQAKLREETIQRVRAEAKKS